MLHDKISSPIIAAAIGTAAQRRRSLIQLRSTLLPCVPQRRLTPAPKIGFDQELRIVFQERAIDLHVFKHALHIIAGL
jgi:hypothetical protein